MLFEYLCFFIVFLKLSYVRSQSFYQNFTGSVICSNEIIKCDPVASKYYSTDGSCNNLKVTWAGRSSTPYRRILPALYGDGVNSPRTRSIVNNQLLPNPRSISLAVHYSKPWLPSNDIYQYTNFGVILGQFIAFDLTRLWPTNVVCTCTQNNPDCINIPTPKGDTFDSDQLCMITPRSLSSYPLFNCQFTVREQIDQETHWLDLSQIYGGTSLLNSQLKGSGGLLQTKIVSGFKYPYLQAAPKNTCRTDTIQQPCFVSGDVRVNENMVLTSIFTLWVREHNNIANELKQVNPSWNDETIYQEARRILIAVYQHIIYNDWLPAMIGTHSELIPLKTGYFNGYNSDMNPQLYNEFSVAAFRFGHGAVQAWGLKADTSLNVMGNISMELMLLQPNQAYVNGGLDALLRGSIVDHSGVYGAHLTDPIQNHMFENPTPGVQTHQESLSALNINRGRDHGTQPYNNYRELCGLKKATSFDDLIGVFSSQTLSDIKSVYNNVNDIDLWTGIVSEIAVSGAMVGPMAICLISKQFLITKVSDRLYFENGQDANTKFTEDQLNEIRQATLSRIICDNLDISKIQPNLFILSNPTSNPFLSCSSYHKINYMLWKEGASSSNTTPPSSGY